MGSVAIMPAISSGTVALIMGIYEQLIYSIKTISGKVPRLILRRRFKDAFRAIPFSFLLPLGLGLFTAIFTLPSFVFYLLESYPEYLWSLFLGLMVATILVVRKRILTWSLFDYIIVAIIAIPTYFLVGTVPVETPYTLLALFISGMIAVCGMILPGISGSFMLVVMGKYEQVLTAVIQRDVLPLAVFTLGTIIGLAVFSRVLSWLFKNHHDIVIALLLGFMIGSLRKIWPWKNVVPDQLSGAVFICVALAAIGFGLVLLLDRLQKHRTTEV